MRILITGATGLIGSSLTQRLLGLSHQITVLSRNVP
ncbi:MAG: NAD-dependent epimerase/dehydratase family protein, partial [Serratia liquefaciens]|nr:NAD-dependent epimerase/dehydratase family protein [Serratia liquefaciens]